MDNSKDQDSPVPELGVSSMALSGRRLIPIQTTTNIYDLQNSDLNMLSPPITPVKRPVIMAQTRTPKIELPLSPRASLEERPASTWANTVPKVFAGKYSVGKQIGAGAWSNVAIAEEIIDPARDADTIQGSLTPPPSPNVGSRGAVLAIKVPNQKAARRILDREARVLTYVTADANSSSWVVDFHGQDQTNGALVLGLEAVTLSRFVSDRRSALQLSTATMYDPVIGEDAWKYLSRHLISGVAWLHNRGVVHGDIKAENILMRRVVQSSDSSMNLDPIANPIYQPIFIDFSSALVDSETPSDREIASADDAITTTYASPELLESFRFSTRTFAKQVDRRKADVWATAVCLVFAATGTEPYAEARMSIQKTAMAKNGNVLGSARGGGQATRIMKGGFVAKTVAKGLCLDAGTRVGAGEWLQGLEF